MAHLPRGTVTLLFTDVEGSTRLLQRLGERYAAVLAAHQRLLRAAFAAHGGREVDTQGDAFFVAFPRALDAVNAAVAAQHALTGCPWPPRTRRWWGGGASKPSCASAWTPRWPGGAGWCWSAGRRGSARARSPRRSPARDWSGGRGWRSGAATTSPRRRPTAPGAR